MKNKRNIIGLSVLLAFFIFFISYGSGNKVKKVLGMDGQQYLQFQVEATASDADYTYRTKGWHIDALFGTKSFNGFFTDSQLEENTSDTTVNLPLKDILEAIGVTDEYLKQGGTLELNAGQIIVVNGTETTPIYDSYNGIVNGIVDRYGVEWSSTAKNDLKSYYDLSIDFEPVAEIPPPIPKISDTSGKVYPANVAISVGVGEKVTLYGDKSWFPEEAKQRIYLWQWKKSTSSTWIDGPVGEGETVFTLTPDEKGTYNIRLGVTDEFEQVK